MIITGIPEVVRQADLADRTIGIVHPEMPVYARRTEREVLADFEAIRPEVLGALLDATSCALANVSSTVLADAPRMLDFATWVEAGAPTFGWAPGTFLDAYVANRREAATGIVEGSFVGQYVELLATEGFEGTATECLARLAVLAGYEATRNRAWPGTPRGLVGILRRLTPALRESGITVEFDTAGRSRHRVIKITAPDVPARKAEVLSFEDVRRIR